MAYRISSFAGAGAQFFDDNGDPLSGGLLYTYTAGTTTPATTWTSISGAVANTNPIVLDSAGRTPNEIWLLTGVTYKFILKTSAGVTIGTYDNLPAVDDPTVFNNLITVTGTNTLIGTSNPPYTAYVTGMTLSFLPVATNTGAVTIDLDGLGAKNIYIDSTTALLAGQLTVGKIALLEYDGTRFQLTSASGTAAGSVTTADIVDGAVTGVKIANGTITATNLASNAVTTDKIANSAITTDKIADGSITGAKIADGVVVRSVNGMTDVVTIATGGITRGTSVTASGTSVDFTGIPSTVKRVTVLFRNVSLSTTGSVLIRLGTSGGVVATGYTTTGSASSNAGNFHTTSVSDIFTDNAGVSNGRNGAVVLDNITGNSWVSSGTLGVYNTGDPATCVSGGSISLASALTTVRIAPSTGTFTGGTLNIFYE